MSKQSVRLNRDFFERPTLKVARDLLGKVIVRRYRGRLLTAFIVETEAYKGPDDRASHAYGALRSPAVEALYGPGGSLHIYFVYGMHWLLNFKTWRPGKPEGVLIRSVCSRAGGKIEVVRGPGRVSKYFKIDRSLRDEDPILSERLWVEESGIVLGPRKVKRGPRVGIDYAGPYWASRPWRFQVEEISI